ncbi:endonuclease MutS2 [Striga asiatica]|uniref:Endonuclease MutS2 n=1 Tax=Striga asiatica TaxID=4170 RepID=A0A5A7R209_STRAF|nr:endonuclease MutS2 [Striga asiatica]
MLTEQYERVKRWRKIHHRRSTINGILAGPIMHSIGQILLEINLQILAVFHATRFQPFIHLIHNISGRVTGRRPDGEQRTVRLDPLFRNLDPFHQIVQKYQLLIAGAHHPMIPNHNNVHIFKNASILQTTNQFPNQPIDLNNGIRNLTIIGPHLVALMIRVFEVQCHKRRNFATGQIEIAQNGIDPLLERHRFVIELTVVFRAVPRAFLHLRSGPEIGGGLQAVVCYGLPERFAQPPLGLVAGHRELVAGVRIREVVVDDAVVGRVESGDDGVVVGESQGGEDWDQS